MVLQAALTLSRLLVPPVVPAASVEEEAEGVPVRVLVPVLAVPVHVPAADGNQCLNNFL